jgi:hypothetical protein
VRLAAVLLLAGLACARANPSYDTDGYTSYLDGGSDRVIDAARADGSSGAAADAPPKPVPGLVGYWRFEDMPGTTRVADSSGNNRHGTLQGLNPNQAWVPGRMGQALAVTSNIPSAGVEVRADAVIDGLRAFTISAWFRRNESTAMTQRSLFSRQLGNTTGEVFNLACSFNSLVVYVPGTGSQVNFEARAQGATVAGMWMHAAGTYDGQWLRLWINGKLAAENNFPDRLVSTSTPVYIGTNKNPTMSEPFEGALDEVALFDRALGQAAIQKLAGGASVFDLAP